MGGLVGMAGPWSGWLQGPRGSLGLVLAHWCAEPGSGVGSCGAVVSRPSVGLLVGGASSLHGSL